MPNDGISLGRTPRLSISTSQKLIPILYALTLAWLCAWVPYERRWHSDGETFRQPLGSAWVWRSLGYPPAEIDMPQIRLKMIAATALGIAALLIAGIVGPAWPKLRQMWNKRRDEGPERKTRKEEPTGTDPPDAAGSPLPLSTPASTSLPTSIAVDLATPRGKTTKWQYVSLCFLLLMFFIWIGSVFFLIASKATFSQDVKWEAPNIAPLLFFILFIAADWKAILNREPSTSAFFRRRHNNVLLVTAGFMGLAILGATIAGIRNGHNREKVHKIEALISGALSAGEIGTKVSAIKNRELKTTTDYVEAYNEIDRLLPEWKRKVQSVSASLADVRGYNLDARISSILAFDSAAIDLAKQIIALTEKEVGVIGEMSKLPPAKQVAFWVEEFQPLQSEEAGLSSKTEDLRKQLSEASDDLSSRLK